METCKAAGDGKAGVRITLPILLLCETAWSYWCQIASVTSTSAWSQKNSWKVCVCRHRHPDHTVVFVNWNTWS